MPIDVNNTDLADEELENPAEEDDDTVQYQNDPARVTDPTVQPPMAPLGHALPYAPLYQ